MKSKKNKCYICSNTIAKTHRFIDCNTCDNIAHIACNQTDVPTYNRIKCNKTLHMCLQCKSNNVEPKSKCDICKRTIGKNHRYITCSLCSLKIHIKCNNTDEKAYKEYIQHQMPIKCINCHALPFTDLDDDQFRNLENEFDYSKPNCGICQKAITKNRKRITCKDCKKQVHTNCSKIDSKIYKLITEGKIPQACIECRPEIFKDKIKCGGCEKTIARNHRYVTCNSCKSNLHIKCNKTDEKSYEKIIKNKDSLICINCKQDNIPFQNLTDIEFSAVSKGIELNTNIESINELTVTSTSLRKFFAEVNKSNPFDDLKTSLDVDDDDSVLINCKYTDIESFNHKKDPNKFSIFHTNIGSISKHIDELRDTLSFLNYDFDIIGITETKIRKNIKTKVNLDIDGYKYYYTPTESEKGGTLIYISDKLNSKPRLDLEKQLYKSGILESSVLEIMNPRKKNILVTCIYRHPSMDLKEFNEDFLTPYMEASEKEKKRHFILGDFNVDLMKIDDDPNSSTFFDTLTSNLFVPHIVHPTRVTSTTKTLIDNIFSNTAHFNEGISGNLTLTLSDHLAQFLIIPETFNIKKNLHNMYTYDMKNFDEEKFMEDVGLIEWTLKKLIERIQDPNIALDDIQDKVNILILKHLPKRKMTPKEIKRKLNPWITNEIIKQINKRNKTHGKFLREDNPEKKIALHETFKNLRREVTQMIVKSKKDYYAKYFEDNSHDLRKTWRGIKGIIRMGENDKSNNISLMIENELVNDPTEVANEFNNYYANIAKKIQQSIYTQGQDFHKYLGSRSDKTFFISPTDKDEILDMINYINMNKASGPNSIPPKILLLIKTQLAEPLAAIFNLSIEKGIYMDKLKISRIVSIYKNKGDKFQSQNYRPISLLSNINKIFEKLMHKRLYKFLEDQLIIFSKQFGFRQRHSTIHALIDLTEDIRKGMDDNNYVCGIFVDLQKAFDTVDHHILLKKLEHYGIRGTANDWFRSYLTGRKQYVSITGHDSEIRLNEVGVPQGSVLGPLLFLIYINDLHKAIKYCTTRHFADDTNLLLKGKNLKQMKKHLNYDLDQLCDWLKANKIALNCDKTEMIIFRHPNKKINYDLKVKVNGKKLRLSSNVKYLGVYLDEHLNWSYHVDALAAKLTRASGMLAKIRHYVNEKTLLNIYHGIFSSIMTYGSQIWGQFTNKHVKRIQKLQNKAIRIINFANFKDSSGPLYQKSKILKLEDQISMENFYFVQRDIQGDLPSPLLNTFIVVPATPNSNQCGVELPKVRTQAYGINSITYRSAATWNTLINQFPECKFHEESKFICKRKITNHYLSKYQ